MATMNIAFYSSVELLPLGVAATLLYLGPFALACIGFRSGPLLTLPAIALAGVVLINRPTSIEEPLGAVAGLTAGCALAIYALSSRQLGKKSGSDTLALAISTSAVVLSPLSITTAHEIQSDQIWILLASGSIGVAGAFSCDFAALRLVGSRAVSVLFALDPAIGALAGALVLNQRLDPVTLAGVAMIVIVGALAAIQAGKGLSTPR